MPSILFVNSRAGISRLLGNLIKAFDGGVASHVGVRFGDYVLDATFLHGVALWHITDWLKKYEIADEISIPCPSWYDETLEKRARARIGQRYDWLEILGYLLLRDLGPKDRAVCSRLAYDIWVDGTGIEVPGKRTGRISPRILHTLVYGVREGRILQDLNSL